MAPYNPLSQLFFSLQILFDNTAHSGMIKISLENRVQINVCKEWNVSGSCKNILTLPHTFH